MQSQWDVVSHEPVANSNPQQSAPSPWDVVSHEPTQAATPAPSDVVTHDPATSPMAGFEVVSHEPAASPSFMDQVGGGIDSTQAAFQRTGAFIADKVGDPALAKGLRIAASENDAQADKVAFKSPHGDSGVKQILNLTNPAWWKATIAEAIPGSAPFLAGAAAGAAVTPFPHPAAKLIGAALGGGAAVVLQEVGPAYDEYLKAHPGKVDKATDFALEKAGLTGVINAASVALGPLGYTSGAIKHGLIQMAIQPVIGVADTVSGNAMEKANIDPNTPLSRGVAKSAVGEIALDAPGITAIARHTLKPQAAKADQTTPKVAEPPSTIEAQMDAFNDGRKPAVLITHGEKMPKVPEGAKTYKAEAGTLIYKDDATLAKALNPETVGEALGYGTGSKPETPTGVVVSKDAQGRTVAEQLTDENNPDVHNAVIAAADNLAGTDGTVELQPVDQAIQQRQATAAAETQGNDTPESINAAQQAPDGREQVLLNMQKAGVKFRKGEADLFHAGDQGTIQAVSDRVNQKVQEREAQRQSFNAIKSGEGFEFNADATQEVTAPQKRTIKTTELPESLHNVTAHTSLAALKGKKGTATHAEYNRAKTGGDTKAAASVVHRVIKDGKIESIRKALDPKKPVYVVPVVNVEGNAVNRLPFAYAHRLARQLGGRVVSSIVKTHGTPNTGEKADARLTKQIEFDGTIPDPNGQYVIADDNYTSGRTAMALFEHVKAQGADVKGITTLASSRYGFGIKPREGAIDKLTEHTGLNTTEMGAILGHDVEHFTNAEINNILRTTKRGAEAFRSRFATQGRQQDSGRAGRAGSAAGNHTAEAGLTLHPQKSGTLLVKGDRAIIRSALQSAGINHKGIPHRDGLLFGKRQGEDVRKALETPNEKPAEPFNTLIKDRNKSIKAAPWSRVKTFATDRRRVLMGALTNLQLVEVYSPVFKRMDDGNPLTQYAKWLQHLEAERNGVLHTAELIDQKWDKLSAKESDAVAMTMNEATVFGIHPDKPFESRMREARKHLKEARTEDEAIDAGREINNETERLKAYPKLRKQYKALSDEAKAIYKDVRDLYSDQFNKTRDELINRIARNIKDPTLRKNSIAEIRLAFMKAITTGPYFPLSRFGDFVVIGRKDGDYVRQQFETSAQQGQAAKRLKTAGFDVSQTKNEEFTPGDIGNAPVFAQQVFDLLEKHGVKDTGLIDDINQLMLRLMPDVSALKHNIHRKGTKGYSSDARRAFAHTIFHGAHHLSRIMYADRMQNEINRIKDEVSLLQHGKQTSLEDGNIAVDLLNEMKVRHEKIMNPNSHPLTSWLGSLGFIWYLGASPAAGIVNLTQTPLVALPMMAGKYGWAKSSAALMRAAKDYTRSPFKAGTYEAWVSLDRSKKIAKSELAMVNELIKDGTFDITQAHALAQLSETDTRHRAKGELRRGRTKAMRYVGAFFHNSEVANRQITALAVYRMAKQKGQTHEEAVNTARKVVFDAHFNYASSNRARFMKSDLVRTLTMFKQYSQHMTYALLRNFNQSFKGESAETRKQARTTLAGMLAMHATFAGTLGLPLASVVFSALNLAFDDEDEPFDARTEYRNWLADTFGTKAGEAIAKGVVNAATPAELHTRISLDELWLRTPDRDLKGKQEAMYYLEQASGPIGSLFLNVWSGAGSIAEGHVERGFEKMVPKFARDFARSVRYHNEGVRTYRGDPVIEDTTAAEEVNQALGFAPARAGERYEARSAVKKQLVGIRDRRRQLLNWYADSVREGNSDKQDEVLAKIQRFNGKNPTLKIDVKTFKQSLKSRFTRSAQTEHGIYLPKNSKGLIGRARFAQ